MGRSFQFSVVLLAMLLLFSSANCVVACVVAPCRTASPSTVPPCHGHHSPASNTPIACSHPLTIADTAHSPAAHLASPGFVVLQFFPSATSLLCLECGPEAAVHSPSPFGVRAISTVVLRI